MGRPTKFTDGIANKICTELTKGRSLTAICKEAEMPGLSTVMLWLTKHESFVERYARARELQADTIFDECLEIADTPILGERRTVRDDGKVETVEEDMLGHRKLMIDTRKWMAGKLRPKKYGDKIDLTSSDGSMSPKGLADFYGALAKPE